MKNARKNEKVKVLEDRKACLEMGKRKFVQNGKICQKSYLSWETYSGDSKQSSKKGTPSGGFIETLNRHPQAINLLFNLAHLWIDYNK